MNPTDELAGLQAFMDALADRIADRVVERLAKREKPDAPLIPNALRVGEVARRLGLSEEEVYRQLRKGTIKSVRLGRLRLVPVSAIEEFLQTRQS